MPVTFLPRCVRFAGCHQRGYGKWSSVRFWHERLRAGHRLDGRRPTLQSVPWRGGLGAFSRLVMLIAVKQAPGRLVC
jgi:hypothetical protein